MSDNLILSDAEIAEICRPLRSSAAQIRYLRDTLHVPVHRRPDGTPLVRRVDFEMQKPPACASDGPRWSRPQ